MFDRLRAVALSLLLIVAFAAPAFAGAFEDAVAKFANDDYSDTADAIEAIAASGNPLAFPIISALQEERLFADPESKKVFIKQADDKIVDAATVPPSTSCLTAPPKYGSTTACAGRSMPRSAA